ncbi:MAG: hypothetical protein HYU66_00625 [Armatimonadetes bacterium]|nr:hypothetical protein [Armatimonadota bacterium]
MKTALAAAPWKSWCAAVAAGGAAWIADYFAHAPFLERLGYQLILPLTLLECVTAIWMQRAAVKHNRVLEEGESEIVVFREDAWYRAWRRFCLVGALLVLFLCIDALSHSPHTFAVWGLGIGVWGNIRATIRHLTTIAECWHMELPEFVEDAGGHVHHRRRRHTEE